MALQPPPCTHYSYNALSSLRISENYFFTSFSRACTLSSRGLELLLNKPQGYRGFSSKKGNVSTSLPADVGRHMGEDSWVCPSWVLREGRQLLSQDQGLAKTTHVTLATLGFPDPCSPRTSAQSLLWVVVSCKAPSECSSSALSGPTVS